MKYKHYRNGETYEVISTYALDASNGAPIGRFVVVYRKYPDGSFYVRDRNEFFGEVDGVLRFTPVEGELCCP